MVKCPKLRVFTSQKQGKQARTYVFNNFYSFPPTDRSMTPICVHKRFYQKTKMPLRASGTFICRQVLG